MKEAKVLSVRINHMQVKWIFARDGAHTSTPYTTRQC